MRAVSSTRVEAHRLRRRPGRARRTTSALAALAIAGGLVVLPAAGESAKADDADSTLTVKWQGDGSSAARFQPSRNSASPHFADFEKLSITVRKTSGLIDQAVRVSVDGFAGTRSSDFAINSQNFLQAMQCWGPDPLAADFRETCQWGGRYAQNSGLGSSVFYDTILRVGPDDVNPYSPTDIDVPFRTVTGTKVSGKPFLQDPDGAGPKIAVAKYPILDYFSPSSTNEVNSSRVGLDGTGSFDFEMQSADQAPQMGCGTPDHLRCWLVIVPRGTHFGGSGSACSSIQDPANNLDPYFYGRPNSVQAGSPISPGCDYWNNRINIPLDFSKVGTGCVVGATEQRVIGSQLMVNAMSSWQPALCSSLKATYSFSTNPDPVARAQILDGTAIVGYAGYPVSAGELETEQDRQKLAKTNFAYAPVAISGAVIGFIAESYAGRVEQLNLSPRLVAKLLTQSYVFTVPRGNSDGVKNIAHLSAVNQTYRFFNQDPEFRLLNPETFERLGNNPSIVLPGPSQSDAIRQVWRWIQADRDAAAFLDGAPDPWGMKVNPYYLPKGNADAVVPWWLDSTKTYVPESTPRAVGLSNVDGTPQKLSQFPLAYFPRADESLVPLQLVTEKSRFDSIQFAPYTDSFLTGARATFRADPKSRVLWDATKLNSAGEAGDWVSSGAQLPGQKFMITVTDSPSAIRYGLNSASLVPSNATSPIAPNRTSFAAALTGLRPTSLENVKQVDPAQSGTSGYPLTVVTYAAVNLSLSTPSQRGAVAAMLRQVTTSGQQITGATGGLPEGYLPLTAEMASQASTAAGAITSYTAGSSTRTTGSGASSATTDETFTDTASGSSATDGAKGAGNPKITGGVDQLSNNVTPSSGVTAWAGSALVVALGIGLAGLLFAPILFRGRGQP